MTLQELKQQVINELSNTYDTIDFDHDVYECKTIWDLINTLNNYGYDKQGSLSIIFSILISQN
jgi:putative lipase involved disintegration of autophagic bodies